MKTASQALWIVAACVWSCARAASIDLATLPEPVRAVFAPELPIEGYWSVHWLPGYDFTVVQIEAREDGALSTTFYRTTDIGMSYQDIPAGIDNGALELT